MKTRFLPAILSGLLSLPLLGQHTTSTFTQTVNQRGTIVELAATPSAGVVVGNSVTLSAILDTAGAPAVTTESIVFKDGSTVLGTVPITQASATNLLPYSQDFTKWTTIANGAADPTLSLTATAPDGTANGATVVTFPATSGTSSSGISYGVTGTSYAGQSVTFSVWLEANAATTVTLQITDDPAITASQTQTCNVSTVWSRCTFTYQMPSNAGTGFAASLFETGAAAQSLSVWGAQFEQAASTGPYIKTTGTAQSGQGGTASFTTTTLAAGSHSITSNYAGDTNFLASQSQPLNLTVGKDTAAIGLTADSATSAYGTQTTFTATVTGSNGTPTGTVTFMDGATTLGTATLTSGVATFQTSQLTAGTHTITAVYSGDTTYNPVPSTGLTHIVTAVAASLSVTSTENPSTYGDSISLTIKATGTATVPTGTVTVADGATSLGTLTLDATGTATLTTANLTAGSHSLTITYNGDTNYY